MKYKARGPYYRAQTCGTIGSVFGRPKRATRAQRDAFAKAVLKVFGKQPRKAKI